jgi:pyruvate/2-oxoglutarate dehydrogenase complex dihydrolipoamide acyltransferase (E2) component
VRGGLDDALDKLARRDQLRRRAAGEATGTPPAVQELVEAIAGVVGRNSELEVTVGVEGVGDPTLLHFFVDDGQVQVTVDPTVASRVTEATPAAPRHADIDLDVDEHVEEVPYRPYTPPDHDDAGASTRRISYDDRDRYDPGTGYDSVPFAEPEPFRRYESPSRESAFPASDAAPADNPYLSPFAATPPPPVPPQTATRRIRPEQHRAPEEPSAAQRAHRAAEDAQRGRGHRSASQAAEPRGMPTPLPEPIPLKVDSQETELAAKRLAALLRDNPTLLRQAPPE